MTTSVKEFHARLPGAPVLSQALGSYIDLLHACLVTGYNVLPCNITVLAGVATVNVGAAQHALIENMVALIEGVASPAALNGEKRVLARLDDQRYTFAAPGVPDGTAIGSIAQRVAPAGWARPFHDAAAGIAVFKPMSVEASDTHYQVTDSHSLQSSWRVARVRLFESMTSATEGVQAGEGLIYSRSQTASDVRWCVIADGRAVHFLCGDAGGTYEPFLYPYGGFGDAVSYVPGDAFGSFVYPSPINGSWADPGSPGSGVWRRNHLGTAAGVQGQVASLPFTVSGGASGANPADGAVPYLFPRALLENAGAVLRGELPGVGACLSNRGQFISTAGTLKPSGWWERVPGVMINGTPRAVLHFGYPVSAKSRGFVFDVTGPWR